MCIRDRLKQYPNVTGIWDNPNYRENIQMIEELMGIKRIRFFYDKTYNGKRVIERLAEQYENEDQELCRSLNHFLQYKDSDVYKRQHPACTQRVSGLNCFAIMLFVFIVFYQLTHLWTQK